MPGISPAKTDAALHERTQRRMPAPAWRRPFLEA
jgi:hypothetical protein